MTKNTEHPYQWAVDGPPIGRWRTASGSFGVAMQSHFVFRPDGTGQILKGNAFGLGDPLPFEWRHTSSGELKLIRLFADMSEAELNNDKKDDANWDKVSYMADFIETDTGTFPVLRDKSAAFPDTFPISFWDVHIAITLVQENAKAGSGKL